MTADQAPLSEDDYEEYDDGPYDDDDDDDGGDCALDLETGQCGNAGSEWCDWDCRWSGSEYFAGSTAWYRARGKRPPWQDHLYEPGLRWPKTWRFHNG